MAIQDPLQATDILRAAKAVEPDKARLYQSLEDIEKRADLVDRIANYILDNPDEFQHNSEDISGISTTVHSQVEQLQELLQLEEEEITRKAERMAAIEQDPEKKGLLEKATDAVKRGWEKVKQHKWKILIALAAIAAGVAIWYYWDYLAALLPDFEWGTSAATEGATEVVTEGGGTDAVGAAIEAANAAEALNSTTFSLVDRSIFYNGVEYLTTDAAQMAKLAEVVKEAATNTDLLATIQRSASTRTTTELALKRLLGESGIDFTTASEFIERAAQ